MKKLTLIAIVLLLGGLSMQAQQIDRVKSALVAAKIDPAAFEFSGQVTATVFLDGQNYSSEDFCLYSVIRGQIRGTSRGMWFEPGKAWIHNHLTYSNASEGDTIRFRLRIPGVGYQVSGVGSQDAGSEQWYEFDEYVVFKPDMLIADALNPFILKTSHLLEPRALSLEPSLEIWPNPVGKQATLKYTLTSDQRVVIQVIDFSGRLVDELNLGSQPAGEHQEIWNPETLKQGVYYLRMKNTPSIYKQVVISR